MQINIHPSARSKLAFLVGALALAAFAFPIPAQQYSISWHKVSGGGGTSSNSPFAVNGTIGQQDAGKTMSGGNFSVTGGFWALYAVQTAGAPALGIMLTTNNTVEVYWPSPSTGWNLQVSTNLATTNWEAPSESTNNNGTINYIIVNPPTGNRYYRLKNP
jgi:hypothetical protein